MNHVMSVVWLDCEDSISSFGSMPECQETRIGFDPDFLRQLLTDDGNEPRHDCGLVRLTEEFHLLIWS